MTPTLRTERLVLEPYAPEDEDDFVALFADDAVARFIGDGPETDAENRNLFRRLFTDVYPHNRFDVWAVRESGRLIGHAEVKDRTDVDRHEIVYALARDRWRRGLGTELAGAIVEYGFETLGLRHLHATVDAENTASLALLEKIGFSRDEPVKGDHGRTIVVLTYRRASLT